MLSPEEQTAIESELSRYDHHSGAGLDALRILQERRGWVSDEAVRDVADYLGLSATEVDAIATFYNLFFRRAVGRHVILVCNSVTCWVMGEDSLLDHLSQRLGIRLGETTADGRFTLLPVPCLGACDRAPVLMVDDDLHQDLTAEKADEVLARYP